MVILMLNRPDYYYDDIDIASRRHHESDSTPPPLPTRFPENETEWISTPGGDIHLDLTVGFIRFLNTMNRSEATGNILYCPKCGESALRVRKNFFGKIYIHRKKGIANTVNHGFPKLDIKAFDTHMEDGKEVIAICLCCDYNRRPLSPDASAKNANIRKNLNPNERLFFCNNCPSVELDLYDKLSNEKMPLNNGKRQITDVNNCYLKCSNCGYEQDFPSD